MIKDLVKRAPLVKTFLQLRDRKRFLSEEGYASHYGVYGSFDEARSSVPPSSEFDQDELASEYSDRLVRVFPYDYPMILWLDRALRDGARSILDVGGNVGVHYFAYQKFIEYPAKLRWAVCEVPAMVAAGQKLSRAHGTVALEFTSDFSPGEVEQADVLISAGSLHYIEAPRLEDLLAGARQRPRHLLLNKLPLYDGDEFVSLQNIRRGFAPHYVWNRARFLRALQLQNYQVIDEWQVLERHFWLPGHPKKSFGAYSGVYLRRS
jgi:putative methyltransferase (TIGR04325 family)